MSADPPWGSFSTHEIADSAGRRALSSPCSCKHLLTALCARTCRFVTPPSAPPARTRVLRKQAAFLLSRQQVRPDPKGTFPECDADRVRLTTPLPAPIAEPAPEPEAAPAPEPETEADVVASPAKGAGKPVRQYLDDTVVPVLRKGLRELVKQRPEDPFEFLADFIKSNKPKASD